MTNEYTGPKIALPTYSVSNSEDSLIYIRVVVKETSSDGAVRTADSNSVPFTVHPSNISDAKVTGVADKTYSGKTITQTPIVKLNGNKLTAGKHYTVSYRNAKGKAIAAKNVKAAGSYKVVVKGKGVYEGQVVKAFKVKPLSVKAKSVKVARIKTQKLQKVGKAVKPKVTVTFGKAKLKQGKDYTVTYKNNKKRGVAQAIVKGKGNFTGQGAMKFRIK